MTDVEADPDDFEPNDPGLRVVEIAPEEAGERLDKTLAARLHDLSRARVQALLADGQVCFRDQPVTDASAKAAPGLYTLLIPPPEAAEPAPEAIPLDVLFEDEHLIVLNKAAGMAAHPGPGTPSGTLVNALLHHCGESL
ncbi:MAG TPA: RluA family pseudouridine synthase, partial [Caulobacteraceae bacterium]|nr:RluA family pseudouridine synthase [Caulobacteraceae bacterium]